MTQRLKKVVDVLDASSGTVRLKKEVQKAAAMELQLESRTTMRLRRVQGGAGDEKKGPSGGAP
jgi:von Willebrand factor type A C-terminal domain